ncbi:uncharacterized protein H6S33_008352 [Morchella sextelata]|uniref:uncharacterized protein n=1 Tax=Morchella sextelata TaxID=1174677 RepID=UPI001D03D2D2|nr:uncharacterized protein H6S33_009834 [Morchella sextelata]XP_044687897.1 uncharacterized protein H6S33_008352 [Morchella sextelata]KAH0602290.1 hypothetical protein H6S33_009834 [Morchella sextelata]KAH0602702.1 hypothetical protein H6S33_008352 [Morchella sextelata]
MTGSRPATLTDKIPELNPCTVMDGDEKPTSSQRREQVLENCRWLFGQEVQLITFYHTFNNGVSNACTALILPKTCSLRDSHADFNSKILWKRECKAKGKKWVTREDAINDLLWEVESKIGEILQTDRKGEFQVNEGAIPSVCFQEVVEPVKEKQPEIVAELPKTVEAPEMGEKRGNDLMEMYELDGRSIRGGNTGHKPAGAGQKIWRIVGYTPSGEPCIEEHEPENGGPPNTMVLNPFKAPHEAPEFSSAHIAEVGLAPLVVSRAVMSDIEAATAYDDRFAIPLNDHDELRNFDEDVKHVNQLIATTVRETYARLSEIQHGGVGGGSSRLAKPSAAYQRTFQDQEIAVKNLLFRINKKNQRLVALAALHRQAEELHVRERIRATESEAREVETNMLLERLFKNRGAGDARSVRSGTDG